MLGVDWTPEPGDRWELAIDEERWWENVLLLDVTFSYLLGDGEEVILHSATGDQTATVRYDVKRGGLVSKGLHRLLPSNADGAVYLERLSVKPLQFRLAVECEPMPADGSELTREGLTTEQGVPLTVDAQDQTLLRPQGMARAVRLSDFQPP